MTSPTNSDSSRRGFLAAVSGAVITSAAALPALAQNISPTPAPRDWSGQQTIQYPDPDIIAIDNRFRKYMIGNTVIKRLYTGTLWAEGPAWNGVGRYLLWSDIPNNVQMRWLEEDGRVTVFRNPSGYSTAIPSTSKAASFPANTEGAAWCAMSRAARSR